MSNKDYPAMTVGQLYLACAKQIEDGNGDKKIMISTDDEGNGYHGLFYSFISDEPTIEVLSDLFHDPVISGHRYESNYNLKDIILLG